MVELAKLRAAWGRQNMLMRVVWINIVVFVALRLIAIGCMFAGHSGAIDGILQWLELPSSLPTLVARPWTAVTYMFTQYDVMHLIFNMLWLYWFGSLFLMVSTQRQFMGLYILGGLIGGALFVAAYNLFPLFRFADGWLIGSSASVIAIVTATAIRIPDFKMQLFLIGAVSLKWIALATILLVVLGVTGSNVGGEIAHVGGVIAGAVYALRLKRGHDITARLNRVIDAVVNFFKRLGSIKLGTREGGRRAPEFTTYNPATDRRTQPTAQAPKTQKSPEMSPADRRELDAILDKIKRSGYAALTPDERKRLFDVSNRIK